PVGMDRDLGRVMGTTLISGVRRRTRPAHVRPGCIGATETELFARSRSGDPDAHEQLVCRFLPMARSLARRYRRAGEPLDDLVQVASVALLKALARFDHERNVAFPSYAVPTIVGELKRHLRDTRWAAYVPQRMRERVLEVNRATESLRPALGRSPTVQEVAREVRIEAAEVADALGAATAHDAVSLDSPAYGAGAEAGPSLADSLGFEEERYELIDYAVTIETALRALPPRQRAILRLRFREDMTQAEIARALGMSQMHVSRLLRQALDRLREVARVRHGQ
ncbi:MAG: SigB/SigF/SigG family RNA polymerase sigma factor, partial [Solirubrobacterales bacterium]